MSHAGNACARYFGSGYVQCRVGIQQNISNLLEVSIKYKDLLTDLIAQFKASGIRTSIFVDADPRMVEGAKAVGTDRIELYTEPYAENLFQKP